MSVACATAPTDVDVSNTLTKSSVLF